MDKIDFGIWHELYAHIFMLLAEINQSIVGQQQDGSPQLLPVSNFLSRMCDNHLMVQQIFNLTTEPMYLLMCNKRRKKSSTSKLDKQGNK